MTSTRVSVLFSDFNGVWGPLSDMYWSQQSSTLLSRHPISTVKEIYSLYCPQCMSRYSDEDAIASFNCCTICRECPACTSIMQADVNYCEFCLWQGCPSLTHTRETTLKNQDALYKVILDSLKEVDKEPLALKRERTVWQSGALKVGEENCEDSSIHSKNSSMSMVKAASLVDMDQSVGSAISPVRGVVLRSKTVLRSKQDSRTGRMNILVQPKILPLEGDSSLKLQKGKWWVKDSSAVNELPFVSVTELPVHEKLLTSSGPCFIELCFTNPKMTEVQISFFVDGLNNMRRPYLRLDRLGMTQVVSTGCSLRCATPPLLSTASDEVLPLAITIGGFEDELLKDIEDEAETAGPLRGEVVNPGHDSGDLSALNSDGRPCWSFRVVHNKAFVRIPVELSDHTSTAPFELDLSFRVGSGSANHSMELPFKVVVAYLDQVKF